jgi:hypothetical protein
MMPKLLIGILVATLVAVAALLAVDEPDPGADAPQASSGNQQVRGCKKRIEGELKPPGRNDTVIGPVAFSGLPGSYRYSRKHPDTGMKSVAMLKPGARVTLVIPRSQRAWLSMGYGAEKGRTTLQACRHHRSREDQLEECGFTPADACIRGRTLFSGGFAIRWADAPQDGRCAELVVRVRGEPEPRREYLFDPKPGACE